MEIEFLKLFSCGSGLILVDCRKQPAVLAATAGILSAKILDRRNGVGADALVLLSREPDGGLSVRMWNRRGEEDDPSSGALSCAARYAFDAGLVSHDAFPIVQRSAAVPARILDSVHSRLTLGIPRNAESPQTIREVPNAPAPRPVEWNGRRLPFVAVRFDRCYGILFTADLSSCASAPADRPGARQEFPPAMQIGFVRIDSREALRLKALRRGGPPDRGRLAAAAVVAAVLQGFTDREVFVHAMGSRMYIQWAEDSNLVHLTAPVSYIFTGTYDHVEEKQPSH